MKKTMTLLCAGLIVWKADAQVIQNGRVSDAQHAGALPGATILIDDKRQSVAGDDGRFRFSGLPAGTYRLRVTAIGYQSKDTTLKTGDIWEIPLTPVRALMRPIEIRAVRASETSPFTQTIVRSSDIERRNLGQDIPYLLDQTPSVVSHSDAGNGIGYTGLRIRGTDATRINITLNGIPYNDAESQGVFFVNLPDFASSASNIQIQRGVGTSTNGTGAFGASIHLNTNEVREKAYGELHNSYGSFDSWRHTLKTGTGLIRDKFTFDTRLSRISSNGFVDRAKSDLQSFYASGAYILSDRSLRFNIFSGKEKTYQAWYGIPESKLDNDRTFNPAGTEKPGAPYDNETDNYRQTHYQLFYNQRYNNRLSLQTALFYTRGLGYYEQYKADRRYSSIGLPAPVVNGTTIQRTDIIRQLWLDNHFFGQTFSLQYKDDRREIIGGGGGSAYLGEHYGKVIWAQQAVPKDHRWYDLDASKRDINSYVKWQESLNDRLLLFADLQYRHVNYDLNGFRDNPTLMVDQTWNFLNPKIGLNYTIPAGRIYLSWAIANKEPNRDDFEAGASQLPKREQLQDIEAGIERGSGKTTWGATAYYMRYRDQLVLTGRINDVGAYTRTNIPNSYRLGLELSASHRPTDRIDIRGNLTLSDNRIIGLTAYYDDYDNGGQIKETFDRSVIAFSPAVTGALTLNFRPTRQTEISLPAKYVSRQYLDNTGRKSRSLDPYFVQDLQLTWKPNIRGALNTAIRLQVNNLFDVRYEPNGYTFSYMAGGALTTENYFFPMAGRNLMIGLSVGW
jgi:iron complex outermembrane receptor protein